MWTHLGHFIGTILGVSINAIGSTLLGKIADVVFVVLVLSLSFRRAHKRGGFKAMKEFWDKDAKSTLKTSLIAAVCIYVPIALWATGKSVYDDHEGLVNRSREQRHEIALKGKEIQDVRDGSKTQLSQCGIEKAELNGANRTLSDQNRDQQNTINNCQTQALKLLTAEPFKIIPLVLDPPDAGVGEHHMKWLLLVNKTVTPVNLRISCQRRFVVGTASFAGSGPLMGASLQKITDTIYQVNIPSPAWTPEQPLIFDMTYRGLSDNACSFNQL